MPKVHHKEAQIKALVPYARHSLVTNVKLKWTFLQARKIGNPGNCFTSSSLSPFSFPWQLEETQSKQHIWHQRSYIVSTSLMDLKNVQKIICIDKIHSAKQKSSLPTSCCPEAVQLFNRYLWLPSLDTKINIFTSVSAICLRNPF